jgi:hypothetical protein
MGTAHTHTHTHVHTHVHHHRHGHDRLIHCERAAGGEYEWMWCCVVHVLENKKPLLRRGSEYILSSLDNVLQTPLRWCMQHIIPTELNAIFLFFWCCKDTIHFF